MHEWYEDTDNVCALGRFLVDRFYITKLKDLLYYFEKPWKWSAEWKEYQEALQEPCNAKK